MAVLPAIALMELSIEYDWRYVAGYLAGVSLLTILLYRSDKRSAQTGEWRISEGKLHLVELAGGWMSAYLCQRIMRHKIRKVSYQISFWAIGLIHQYSAFDYLHAWEYSQRAYQFGSNIYAMMVIAV